VAVVWLAHAHNRFRKQTHARTLTHRPRVDIRASPERRLITGNEQSGVARDQLSNYIWDPEHRAFFCPIGKFSRQKCERLNSTFPQTESFYHSHFAQDSSTLGYVWLFRLRDRSCPQAGVGGWINHEVCDTCPVHRQTYRWILSQSQSVTTPWATLFHQKVIEKEEKKQN